jgi:hypothetical protein
MSVRRSAVLVSAPPSRLAGEPTHALGCSDERLPSRVHERFIRSQAFRLYRANRTSPPVGWSTTHPPLAHPRRTMPRGTTHRNFAPLPVPRAAPLLRFSSPSAPSVPGVHLATVALGDKSPVATRRPPACLACSLSAYRVSHPLGGFLLPIPRRLVSSDRHPWGSQPLGLRAQPVDVAKPPRSVTSGDLNERTRSHRAKATTPIAPAPAQ